MKNIVLSAQQLATEVQLLPRYINRDIDGKHVSKLKRSISKFGVLRDSVTVRAPFIGPYLYTLDGQHLHQACIELGLSVRSKVVDVSSEKELINFISAMNSTSKKWGIIDYVNSWSANGMSDYNIITNRMNQYNLKCPALFLSIYNRGKKVSAHNLKSGLFVADKEYGDILLDMYNVLIDSGMAKSAASLKAFYMLYGKYQEHLNVPTVKRLGQLIKNNIKVYSQKVHSMQYESYLDEHINQIVRS